MEAERMNKLATTLSQELDLLTVIINPTTWMILIEKETLVIIVHEIRENKLSVNWTSTDHCFILFVVAVAFQLPLVYIQ